MTAILWPPSMLPTEQVTYVTVVFVNPFRQAWISTAARSQTSLGTVLYSIDAFVDDDPRMRAGPIGVMMIRNGANRGVHCIPLDQTHSS